MRAQRVASVLVGVLVGLAPAAPTRAQDPETVRIRTLGLAPGVFMMMGSGGNLGVCVGSDGAFLVDDQFAPLTGKIRSAIAELSPEPIRFVLNTHWHQDHTGGNENLGGAGAVIVAHENVRQRMSTEQFMAGLGRRVPPSPSGALPVVTFTRAVTFHWNGEEIQVEHVPAAHTDGDAVVFFRKANVIHAGDTFFNGMYPFVDVSSGGRLEGMISAAEFLLERADDSTRIIPGHGPIATRADLRAYRDMLSTVAQRVRAAIARGESEADVVASRPTADLDATWGGGFMTPERFVRIAYASLSAR